MTMEITEEAVARYWDGNAELWTEQVRRGRDFYREYFNNPTFFRFIGNLKGRMVLDAGCGEGRNTRILARSGAHVTGVDISPRMIELARQEEQREPLGIRYEVTSFSKLSLFADASFDVVISFMAVMDSPDYEDALREFHRVLRRKGRLFFSVSHPCFMTKGYGWIENERGEGVKITASHYFNRQPWVEYWRFKRVGNPEEVPPFAVPTFPRTISEYLNALIKAGFVLKRMAEPRPSRRMCQEHPWLRRWREHAALFLHVHAVKT